MNDEPMVIRVAREFCGHSSRVAGWEWAEAPPHVKTFITGDLGAVVLELAANGYAFRVEVASTEISLLEWLGAGALEKSTDPG